MANTFPSVLKKPVRFWLTVAAAIVVVLLVWQGFQVASGIRDLRHAVASARAFEAAWGGNSVDRGVDLPALKNVVDGLSADLNRAHSKLAPALVLTPAIGWVPKLGPRVSSARDMLDLSLPMVDASRELLTAFDSALVKAPGPVILPGRQLNTSAFQALSEAASSLNSARAQLAKAQVFQKKLQRRSLTPSETEMLSVSQQVMPDLDAAVDIGLAASGAWRAFLGYDGPKTYLIIAVNSDELRAAGGFIAGAWQLTLDQGRISELRYWDTVEVDNLKQASPLPPQDLLRMLWGGGWLFRDATWYPDFPTSARVAERLFQLGTGIPIDGVIASDQWTVQRLLGAIGPVAVPGGDQIDQDSYLPVLEQQTDLQGRGYMDSIMTGMLDTLGGSGSNNLVGLMRAVSRALAEKHLQLYFHDSDLEQIANRYRWDGALSGASGDYLMVVDSNVGLNKVNRMMQQGIDYQIDIGPLGEATSRLQVTYANVGERRSPQACAVQAPDVSGGTYEEAKNACYWDYVRVYTPAGSKLQSSSPFPMPPGSLYSRLGYNDIQNTLTTYQENGKSVVSGLFTVAPQDARQLAFLYQLPSATARVDGDKLSYNLFVQKQPGQLDMPLSLTVRFPNGYILMDSNLQPMGLDGNEARFEATLASDVTLRLVLTRKRS